MTSNYTYDAIYQLTQVTQGTNTTESYSYDPVGNRTASLGIASYSTNSSNELTATSNSSYTYDANGNTTSKTSSNNTTTYSWDYENRLTSVTLPGSGGTVSFKYDPFGRRIYKSSSSATSIFAYDGDNLVEEANSSGAEVAAYSQGVSIDEPLAMQRSSAKSFYETDGLGSVTSLSSTAGSLAETYARDSFGEQTASSGSLTNPFQYTARESDTETSLYYYRARYYDQNTGKFLSEDPMNFLTGENFYIYVNNSPVIYNDPSGLVQCTYSISLHTLSCTSYDYTQSFETSNVRSGHGACRNNVACQAKHDAGPVPQGNYWMGGLGRTPKPHTIPRIPLDPMKDTITYNRTLLQVHQGGDNSSTGCIVLNPADYGRFMRFYRKDDNGWITVTE